MKKVYLQGSRSPLRDKKPTRNSDWDFAVITDNVGLAIPHPRFTKMLHADLCVLHENEEAGPLGWNVVEGLVMVRPGRLHDKAVEVWPDDPHNVFKRIRKK